METTTTTFHEMAHAAIEEISGVLARTGSDEAEHMCAEIRKARRIACYGVGREGLMMKALCMRLMHLGLDAHFVGDMTTPPLGPGDLLIASAVRVPSRPYWRCKALRSRPEHVSWSLQLNPMETCRERPKR
jgi:DNA-binding MurR/RpiR family transcriptional regulator